jgi:hypothetical protein
VDSVLQFGVNMKTPGHAWSRVEDSCVVHVVVWHGVFNFEASLLVELKREVSVSWFLYFIMFD